MSGPSKPRGPSKPNAPSEPRRFSFPAVGGRGPGAWLHGARKRVLAVATVTLVATAVVAAVLAFATRAALLPLPASLDRYVSAGIDADSVQITDRRGVPLTVTYSQAWNVHDRVALHAVPAFLRNAFIAAEDKRFFEHGGADWVARMSALVTNVANRRAVRGASTITEQVVRMLHPRPRTVWSRWLEGWEAARLERRFTKQEILEFYLNQVPYASNRRGVVQAARHYFARDLGTLSRKEMLALAVLVRAPSTLDLRKGADASAPAIARLADALVTGGVLTGDERDAVLAAPLALEPPHLPVVAPHFVRYVRGEIAAASSSAGAGRPPLSAATPRVATTLDAGLQAQVQALLDDRMRDLARREAAHGGVLVVDHTTGEVLVWAVAGGGNPEGPETYIDSIITARQPGSALKPFLYARAIDDGSTAATIIDDLPLVESTSFGLHSYRNYSRRFYGPVTLRDALGNSLNIPAVKTLQHVGAEAYLATLAALGFAGLAEHPDFYGDGIALGTGEVTLLELVQAYAALANRGVFRALAVLRGDLRPRQPRRVFSAEAASLVADILSDADARSLEFGRGSVLAFPVQTAVKTGTSSDFRDAWAVGFNYRYVVGAWIGNLDRRPSNGVTGSTGPALLLRAVFAELTRGAETKPLFLSPRLVRRTVCVAMPDAAVTNGTDVAGRGCIEREEWFVPEAAPSQASAKNASSERFVLGDTRPAATSPEIRWRQPAPGLQLAYDPRLPPDAQVFELALDGVSPDDVVEWTIDGEDRKSSGGRLRWTISRGDHRVAAAVYRGGVRIAVLPEVAFVVR